MERTLPIQIPQDKLTEFCQRHHIRKLSLFGSVLRDDFTAKSDVDFLVEFEPETRVTFLDLAGMEIELSDLIQRKADLRTPKELSRHFRQDVLDKAMVQYAKN
jgi:predicted nucleotidyltransferase